MTCVFFELKRGWLAGDSLLGTNLFFPFPTTWREGVFLCFFGELTYSFGASSKIPCQADMAGSASIEMILVQRLAAISWGPPRIVDLHIHMIYKKYPGN